MALELKRVTPAALRSLGLDEKWLQERIQTDPALLGLGDLEIVSREHRQPTGGRIDFLMRDAETTYYEVEIMLGVLNESHIIRTIEYWDLERQRRPQFDHRAVIVAEKITSRFFNVLRLLNRGVPMIAVQLNTFQLNETEIALHPVTVLNVVEEIEDNADVDPAERADRPYWEKKAPFGFLAVIDQMVLALRQDGVEPRLIYNRHHVVLGTTGYNFCWFEPRVVAANCHVDCRVAADMRDATLAALSADGMEAVGKYTDHIIFNIQAGVVDSHSVVLLKLLRLGNEWSRT